MHFPVQANLIKWANCFSRDFFFVDNVLRPHNLGTGGANVERLAIVHVLI